MSAHPIALALSGSSLPDTELTVRRADDRVDLMCLSGTLDTIAASALEPVLHEHLDPAERAARRLVLDLTDLRLISAAAVRILDTATRHLSDQPVLVIASASRVRELFSYAPPTGLRVFPTLAAALGSLPPSHDASPSTPEASTANESAEERAASDGRKREELQQEVFGLRAKSRTASVISMAMGILRERYGLHGGEAAFEALRDASQHLNVPLRVLASAITTAPAPKTIEGDWFPSRRHTAPPAIGLLGRHELIMTDRRQVLDTFVHDVLTLTGAHAAELHLTEPALRNALILEAHAGLTADYRDQVHVITAPPALAAHAHAQRAPVAVPDIAAEPGIAGSKFGAAALAMGSRALYALPSLTDDGTRIGVFTTHRTQPGNWMNSAQLLALNTLAQDLATWRSWYRRTIVLDALEQLHHRARTHT
ncbi:ANTAR domain-containing protein [Streptomyces sp. NPDC048489]|uniref:ANTAR domain-containing protein n=1 Tax=Streptomyces sp. NPDC048489 TaxID=3154504 RepID=UPI00341BEB0D